MKELAIEKAKEIICEPVGLTLSGRNQNLLKFTRLCMASEVQTINEIEAIKSGSHDLVHLSGVHKFRYSSLKAEELRWFWSCLWRDGKFMYQVKGLREYIIDVLEASSSKGGWCKRPMGLFLGNSGWGRATYPWRTSEWYAERRANSRVPFVPVSEFYPYITSEPNEEHQFLLEIDSLVPKGLPNEMRSDVCQDMIVAVLSGQTTIENLKDSRAQYIKQFYKQFPVKYGHLSLDAPLKVGETETTIADLIAVEYK
jgi:hypothetical protein